MKRLTLAFATLAVLTPVGLVATVVARETPSQNGQATSSQDERQSKLEDAKDSVEKHGKVRLAHIVIKGELPESPGQMSLFGDLGTDLRKTIGRLEKASDDDSIAGVILQVEASPGRGKLNELRAAIQRVRAGGKKVYAQLESAFGSQYLLAAACDEVVMPESGVVMIPGVRAEVAFFKDMLDKIGVEADMLHIGAAKAAAEPFTRDSMSDAVRENLTALVDDVFDQMVTTIATDRGLKVDEARAAIDRGLLTANQAQKVGLIDRVAYPDAFRAQLKRQYNADELAYVINYARKKVDADFSGPMGVMKLFQALLGGSSKSADKGPKVAIVYAVGPIMSGKSQSNPFGGQVMGSTTIVEALDKAAKEDSVKAIVLRVNSPGGSALASDLIWRATQRIDKPIIASMGDVAGSGGYYISMGADRILAEPGTVTGSIGVVGGKFAMSGLFEKIGVDTEIISRGKNSGILSINDKFSDSERDVVKQMMQEIYEQFTAKAAEGRGMKLDELKKLAGGKVYTGRVAKRNGLVDEIGTLKDAIGQARTMAGLSADDDVGLKILPEPQSPLEMLFGEDMDAQREASVAALLPQLAPELMPLLRHAWTLKQLMREPAAVVMPYRVKIQ